MSFWNEWQYLKQKAHNDGALYRRLEAEKLIDERKEKVDGELPRPTKQDSVRSSRS